MHLWLDTANIEEIREINSWGILGGVTTNPSLVAKEGRNFRQVIEEIGAIVDGPISAETVSLNAEGIVAEAREVCSWHPNVVAKVPLIPEGLKAVKILAAEGISTNMTLCFSLNQAIMAALAGATFVSPFLGRVDDIGWEGMELLRDIIAVYDLYCFETRVIAASMRHPLHVADAARSGAHIATCPYAVINRMIKHPLTDIGIDRFLKDWKELPENLRKII